jgi:hypothetical protein
LTGRAAGRLLEEPQPHGSGGERRDEIAQAIATRKTQCLPFSSLRTAQWHSLVYSTRPLIGCAVLAQLQGYRQPFADWEDYATEILSVHQLDVVSAAVTWAINHADGFWKPRVRGMRALAKCLPNHPEAIPTHAQGAT